MIMLDHIICIVPNLDEAIQFFSKNLLGTPIKGGKHVSFGTHNALISLGNKRY